jgi:hypothetical protein
MSPGGSSSGSEREKLREGYRGTLWDMVEGRPGNLHVGHIEKAAGLGVAFMDERSA